MRRYIRRARKLSRVRPRTFWFEYSYYTVTIGDVQRFHFGIRPQDLAHLESIRQREWERHQAYLRNHKDEPEIVEFFTLNRLLDIVRSGNEREQLYQFRKMMYDAEVGLVPERER